jgi:hypothetical protein
MEKWDHGNDSGSDYDPYEGIDPGLLDADAEGVLAKVARKSGSRKNAAPKIAKFNRLIDDELLMETEDLPI